MINTHFVSNSILSNESEAFSLYEKSNFGEKKESKIEYSFVEALFLLENKRIKVISNKKEISFLDLLKKVKKIDKKIEMKLPVYADLRKKGYIVKSALKFGADFRVYDKGSRPGQSHAPWIVYTTKDSDNLNWQDFAAKNRIAHSTKKKLLIAILDQEGDVSYYQVSWLKP